MTYRFGDRGLHLRQQQIAPAHAQTLPVGSTLAGQRVVLSMDSGRACLRTAKAGRRRRSGRHGYVGEWQEPKVLTLYVVDAAGHKVNPLQLPVTNDGTFAPVDDFMALLEMHLVRLGIAQAAQILLLADGAPWIWDRGPALLLRLGCPAERVLELVDFYHATEQLTVFAEAAFAKPAQAQAWLRKACSALKHKSAAALLAQMQARVAQAPAKRRAAMTNALSFLTGRVARLQYARVAALKLPIGSGAIESLLRQVVNLRLKGAGKFGLQPHAESLLHARCQWAAGQRREGL